MLQKVGNVTQGIYNRFKTLFNVIGVFVLFLIFNQVWENYKDYKAFRYFEKQGQIVFFKDNKGYTFEFEDLDLIKKYPNSNCFLGEIVIFNTPAPQVDTSTIGQNTYPLK